MFLAILLLILVLGWLALVAGSYAGGYLLVRSGLSSDDSGDRLFLSGLGVLTLVGAIGLTALTGAVATGEIKLAGHPDGCYYIHTIVVGKSLVQQWDPIRCVSQ